ncbi:translation initiation factor IF-2-like [Lutra lutra]|uniref:translation initiation factor IF-2-like n=1 Tax=Lutra lutra TaxID=9657 RepID=UPI001FD4894F|nr:translation initiation factor IF-2-like [Lutra lutra]
MGPPTGCGPAPAPGSPSPSSPRRPGRSGRVGRPRGCTRAGPACSPAPASGSSRCRLRGLRAHGTAGRAPEPEPLSPRETGSVRMCGGHAGAGLPAGFGARGGKSVRFLAELGGPAVFAPGRLHDAGRTPEPPGGARPGGFRAPSRSRAVFRTVRPHRGAPERRTCSPAQPPSVRLPPGLCLSPGLQSLARGREPCGVRLLASGLCHDLPGVLYIFRISMPC